MKSKKELEEFIENLTPTQLLKLQASLNTKHPPTKIKREEKMAVYTYTCLLCFNTTIEEKPYQATTINTKASLKETHLTFFTPYCSECRTELSKLPKEIIVERCIKAMKGAFIGKDAMKAFTDKERGEKDAKI